MQVYIMQTNSAYGNIKVCVFKKDIKNVHLRVYRDMTVKLSVPFAVDSSWIADFLSSRKDWIVQKLELYRTTDGYNNLVDLRNGSSTQMLGKDMRIIKTIADKNDIVVKENNICVSLRNDDEKTLNRLFGTWWRQQAFKVYSQLVDKLYDKIFKKYSISKPSIVVKKMKTLWGSCTKALNKITINEYLLKADILCIEYVILHELTHLLIPNHSKDFYNFLTIHMPDWKQRKKQLDTETVQGV